MDDFPCVHVTPEAGAEAALEVFELNRLQLSKHGITDDYLARKLKEELEAKLSKIFLVKSSGYHPPKEEGEGEEKEEQPAGPRLFDARGNIIKDIPHNGNGNGHGKTIKLWEGNTIISQHGSHHQELHEVELINWDIQQRARIDAHKLRRDYPPEKRELSGSIGLADADRLIEALERASAARDAAATNKDTDKE